MNDEKIFWIRDMPPKKMSATISLSTLAVGAFIRLYWACFSRQPLPDDDKQLARITGLTVKQWNQLREEVKPHFIVDDSGWYNETIMEELSLAAERYQKRADAGRKGGEATAKKRKEADHVH